jgi:hypothetical protein
MYRYRLSAPHLRQLMSARLKVPYLHISIVPLAHESANTLPKKAARSNLLNCERSREISPNPTGTKSSSRARRKSGRVLGNLLTTPKNRRRSPPGSPSSASGARLPGRRNGPARPPVWKSTSVSGARAVRRNEHHHAIEQASRRWRERAVKF